MEPTGHITMVKPDKCMLSEIRDLFIGRIQTAQHEHTDRRVYFYPDEVFVVEDKNGEKIFFVPVVPLNGKGRPEKRPIPIFMCDFSGHHKTEIIKYGDINGIKILYKHFSKPQISISYVERLEYELANEAIEEEI